MSDVEVVEEVEENWEFSPERISDKRNKWNKSRKFVEFERKSEIRKFEE